VHEMALEPQLVEERVCFCRTAHDRFGSTNRLGSEFEDTRGCGIPKSTAGHGPIEKQQAESACSCELHGHMIVLLLYAVGLVDEDKLGKMVSHLLRCHRSECGDDDQVTNGCPSGRRSVDVQISAGAYSRALRR